MTMRPGARIILITGGLRGGKSRYAVALAQGIKGGRVYLATAERSDKEMKERIQRHRKERNKNFTTVEEPLYLARALKRIGDKPVIVIDCLTLWMNNLIYYFKDNQKDIEQEVVKFIAGLKGHSSSIIIVTNEVGSGIIPDNPLSRRYIEILGSANKRVAEVCDEVIMMVSGIPVYIKRRSRDSTAIRLPGRSVRRSNNSAASLG